MATTMQRHVVRTSWPARENARLMRATSERIAERHHDEEKGTLLEEAMESYLGYWKAVDAGVLPRRVQRKRYQPKRELTIVGMEEEEGFVNRPFMALESLEIQVARVREEEKVEPSIIFVELSLQEKVAILVQVLMENDHLDETLELLGIEDPGSVELTSGFFEELEEAAEIVADSVCN